MRRATASTGSEIPVVNADWSGSWNITAATKRFVGAAEDAPEQLAKCILLAGSAMCLK
jgi:hypothetical protein